MQGQVYRVAGRFPLGDLHERRPLGDLYRGSDDQTGQTVGIFFVSPHVVQSTMHRDQILRELDQLATVGSNLFFRILDKGLIEEDGRIYVVTEDVSLPTISSIIGERGALPLEQAVLVIRKVAEGLRELQRVGLLHREISPSHVLLGEDDVKILNYCVAESLGDSIFGDPWFMSPEQAMGRPVDLRSNIYSLGALFYYIITGTPPFMDAEIPALLHQHKSAEPDPPSTRRSDLDLSQQVDSFVAKSMAKSALARQFSLDQFIAEAEKLVTSARPEMEPAPVPRAAPAPRAAAFVPAPVAPPPLESHAPAEPADMASPEEAASAVTMATPASSMSSLSQPEPTARAETQADPPSEPEPGSAAEDHERATARPGKRRGRKGGFRVTMWFMKGEKMQQEAEAEDELDKVSMGTGDISDKEKTLDERYMDDGSLTATDRAQFSLQTGQTGMMPAVQVPEGGYTGKAIDEKEVVDTLDRGRRAWIWVIIVVVVVGIAAFAFFMWRSTIPPTFIQSGLFNDLKEKVSSFKTAPPKIAWPINEAFPTGDLKETYSKLKATAKDPKQLLPETGFGAGHYLVSLEKSRLAHEKKAPEPRRKKRRRASPQDFYSLLSDKKSSEAKQEYDALKGMVTAALLDVVAKLKGKTFEGGDQKPWIAAMRAANILLALPAGFKGKEELVKSVDQISVFFQKPAEPAKTEKTALPDKAAFDKLKVGAALEEAIKTLGCAESSPAPGADPAKAKRYAVICKGKESKASVELTVDAKTKKLVSARMKDGDKTYQIPENAPPPESTPPAPRGKRKRRRR